MSNRVMLISSTVSHALAWIVYLVVTFSLVIWPAWQHGDGEDLRVLATVFMPGGADWLGSVNRTGPGPTGRRQADVSYICGLAHRVLWSGHSLHRPDSSTRVGQSNHWADCRLLPDNPDAGCRSGWSVVADGDYGGSAPGVQRLSRLFSWNLLSAGSSGDVGRNGGEFVDQVVAEELSDPVAFARLEAMPAGSWCRCRALGWWGRWQVGVDPPCCCSGLRTGVSFASLLASSSAAFMNGSTTVLLPGRLMTFAGGRVPASCVTFGQWRSLISGL